MRECVYVYMSCVRACAQRWYTFDVRGIFILDMAESWRKCSFFNSNVYRMCALYASTVEMGTRLGFEIGLHTRSASASLADYAEAEMAWISC